MEWKTSKTAPGTDASLTCTVLRSFVFFRFKSSFVYVSSSPMDRDPVCIQPHTVTACRTMRPGSRAYGSAYELFNEPRGPPRVQ